MAITKTVNIDVETRDALKNMNELGKSFEDVFGEVMPLTGRIGELEDALYEMALAGDTSSEEFQKLSQQVGEMKRVIMETDLTLDGMSQTMSQSVGGAIGGLAAGFELSQGAMAAFGVESEAVESALLKVQSAMAISQGIQGIREAIPSFNALKIAIAKTAAGQWLLNAAQTAGAVGMKVLNAVMNMNPVFLLITAFAALATAVAYFSTQTEYAEEQNERLNASYKKSEELINKVTTATQRRTAHELKMLEIAGASEDELHKKKLSNMEEERKVRQLALKIEQKNIEVKRMLYDQALKEDNAELAESIKEEIAQHKAKYKDLVNQHEDYVVSKTEEDAQYIKQQEEKAEQEKQENAQKYRDFLAQQREYNANRLAIAREIQDQEIALMEEGERKANEELRVWLERRKQDILADTKATEDEKLKLIELAERSFYDKRAQIAEEYEIKLETKKAEGIAKEEESALIGALKFAASEEARTQTFKEHLEERANANAAAMQKMEDASRGYTDAAMQGLQALDELNSMLTDDAVKKAGANEAAAEAARKKGFERSKKLQLTMAIITGVQGVMAAFTAGSSMGPAGVVMGPVMAALAAVTAGINIAKIAKMKYEGGGGTSVGGSTPSAPSVPSAGASFNVVGAGGANQLAQTLGGQSQEPIQAYVVSGEVTTAQSLDRNRVENATL